MNDTDSLNDSVHVFAGNFSSRADACEYTEEQWEPEPDESASDEEYDAWSERNPVWAFRTDLDVYLDSDFIETIDGEERYSYLEDLLVDRESISSIKEKAPEGANILTLVFREALGGFAAGMKSTEELIYCGEYACKR